MGCGEPTPFKIAQLYRKQSSIGYFPIEMSTHGEKQLFGAAQDLVTSVARHRLNMDSGFQLYEQKAVQVGALTLALRQSTQDTGLKTKDLAFKLALNIASTEELSHLGDWAFRNYTYLQSNVYPEKGQFYTEALYSITPRTRNALMSNYVERALGAPYAKEFMKAFWEKCKTAATEKMPFLHRVFINPQIDAYQVIMNAIDDQFSKRGLQKKFWGLFWR